MARYMLDTDTVSFALRGAGNVASRLAAHQPSEVCISSVTLAELRFGADRRGSRRLHALIDAFVTGVRVAAFDEQAANRFGRVGVSLAQAGTPIGQFDTLIAAHALALALILVTGNRRHFDRVQGLRMVNWFD